MRLTWFRKAAPSPKKKDPEKALTAGLAPAGETFISPKEDLDGKHVLGQTRSKKPVYASGSEADKYDANDHEDAAKLHMRAHEHHDARGHEHRGNVVGDDWRQDEAHEVDAERHEALADHHHEIASHHLGASGKGSTIGLHFTGGRLQLGVAKPHGKEDRAKSEAFFKGRTHRDHPGGLTEADKAAYQDMEER